ncbi:hypothetical protein [Nodularia sphaerocarpa]|uniref:hypothetical protein n=1 Tax=Nodularia sphaerocarpa TaxID=137816 RepID=UPI001EFB26F4|nr:hypothetical protein [Nodularia sphaerocarpa]MDB9373436.1 hypothetical protein [Nodularia sphaerocarpa CS-585]MDB9379777.1 hypothetical protein [Nodularia sphaerocarpa CS-585A2]ULP74046.1 hypothetical protein BDGGKGIB_03706 [Nodularia sphaerocarpa UHCC 0038]
MNSSIISQHYINLVLTVFWSFSIQFPVKSAEKIPPNVDSKKLPISSQDMTSKKLVPQISSDIFITQTPTPELIQIFPNFNEIDIPGILNAPEILESEPRETNEETTEQLLPRQAQAAIILNAITNSANRYPWIVHPTDNIKFSSSFNPNNHQNYTDFSIKFAAEEPIINKFNFANFPNQEQFYWILPDNRVVIETQGWQSQISYQGQSIEIERRQTVQLTQRLWGKQAVSAIPQTFQELTGEIDLKKFYIQSIAAESINPQGNAATPIIISSDFFQDNQNVNSLSLPNNNILNLSNSSTYSSRGEGALFESLDIENTPLILQAFPTNNLQPLLEDGLFVGAKLSQETLAKLGISWGNPLNGETSDFQPEVTSLPGIKIGQLGKFDNWDLLNILVNPFISEKERKLYYLNSLYWVSLGQREPQLIRSSEQTESYNWHKFDFSRPHNQTLIQYDAAESKATYTNIFSNPGISLSLSSNQTRIDQLQTANSTIGMLMGGFFKLINSQPLSQSLTEAKALLARQDNFAPLNSKATPEQRRQINERLNRTLLLGNRSSALAQISGTFTFPSLITPNSSNLFQIRTGNHKRGIQFINGNSIWNAGNTYISQAQLSDNRFGSLSFTGVPIPLDKTSVIPSNRSSAVQVNLINPDGLQFVQNFNSLDMIAVPMNVRSVDMAFDRLELSQLGQINTQLQTFRGYLYLPTIEGLWSGSFGKWNYSINSGIWFNLNSDSAFHITKNNLGVPEPNMGVYANGLLNFINTHYEVNAEGQTLAITNHIPALRFSWNNAANSSNSNYLNLSYSFSRQNRNLNYSLNSGILLIDNQVNWQELGFLQGKLALRTGLEFSTSVEISDNFFSSFESIQALNSSWSVGAYLQNFRNTDQGIKNRVSDLFYGLIIKNNLADNGGFWESRLGISGNGLEIRFEGGLQF